MTIFGILAFVFALASYPPYTLAVISKKVTPKISSWIIWAMIDIIVFITYWATGTFSFQLLAFSIGACLVLTLSIKYGTFSWDKTDTVSLSITLVAILLWIYLGPRAGLICALIGFTAGMVPTIIYVARGNNEALLAWVLVTCSTVFSLLDGNILTSAVYIPLQTIVIVYIVYHRHIKIHLKETRLSFKYE